MTWDDPASPGKDPNDHTSNRYDYFLISDTQLNKDHIASSIPSNCGSCAKDYDRLSILNYGMNSGNYGNVALATNANEVNAAIKKYMEKGYTSFWLWYYDSSITENSMWDRIIGDIAKCEYPAACNYLYAPENNITKYQLDISPMSEWNTIPVVKNGAEFTAKFNEKKSAGNTKFKIRYETTNGAIDLGSTGGFSYTAEAYNNGKSYLLTIFIE